MENTDLRYRLFLFLVFLFLTILTLAMLRPFLTVIIVSLISVIMLKPLYDIFAGRKRVRGRKWLASSLTLLTFFLLLIIPLFLIVWLTASQLSELFEELASLDLEAGIRGIGETLQDLPFAGRVELDAANAAEAAQSVARFVGRALADFAVSIASSLPNLFVQGLIFVILVASLLPVYDILIPQLEQISPLGSETSALYNLKITAMVRSLILGVFLIAILQGAAMGFFFWLAGLDYVFLLSALSMVLAVIPMVGISWLVIAIAVVSFLTGQHAQAIIVLFGFYGVVNWIDLLLRPRLLSEEASLNFALFVLALLGGLAWAGVMGLFYGPVIMLLLVTTIQVYTEQYAKEDSGFLDRRLRGRGANGAAGEAAAEAEPG